MRMAVKVGPNRGVGVEVSLAARVPQHRTFAAHNCNRLAAQPIAHLRERVPDVLVIEFGEFIHLLESADQRGDIFGRMCCA
jgi:hypothetical protein